MSAEGVRAEAYYEAVLDDDAYGGLPDLLAQAGGARSAMMLWCHDTALLPASSYNYFPAAMMEDYAARWGSEDPWYHCAARSGRYNEAVLTEQYVPSGMFAHSRFFNDFVRRYGDDTFHCLGGVIRSDWGFGVISVQRGRGQAAFDEEVRQAFVPAFARAEIVFRLRGELAAARHQLAEARALNDSLLVAVLVVRRDGRIVEHNAAAEAVLARGDGLVQREGRLAALQMDDQRRLEAGLRAATAAQAEASTFAVQRGGEGGRYLVTSAPKPGAGGDGLAILVFQDPDLPQSLRAAQLKDLYGLTHAEAAVAIEIARGRSPEQIARRRGVRITTVRAQLRALALKTGLSRQAELARLVHALPPLR